MDDFMERLFHHVDDNVKIQNGTKYKTYCISIGLHKPILIASDNVNEPAITDFHNKMECMFDCAAGTDNMLKNKDGAEFNLDHVGPVNIMHMTLYNEKFTRVYFKIIIQHRNNIHLNIDKVRSILNEVVGPHSSMISQGEMEYQKGEHLSMTDIINLSEKYSR